eukprot:CAMPEP_0174342778 /NCGR_PEP_ID=MMETSP0810-20121108/26420_1 /TAXON_ID=73025 ORGANISM="Eutreptiella gymnastica-like, Strain CCMP1594" /NCGR_SAMPLE_ID=MMETSP0810 /ASSEMBLY_ACC=CAM_ASM_000659 /LENGTH=141 /DNA_ID=CAMNT_0015465091 /DNA_START=703 /DNA_END=1125 /DNA_ORIENTATION=-
MNNSRRKHQPPRALSRNIGVGPTVKATKPLLLMGAGLEVWREGRCWGLSPHEELTGRTGPETEHRKNRLLMTLEANEQADVQEGRAVTVLHAPQLPLPKAHKMRLDADRLLRRWPVCSPPAERPDNCLALEAWGRLGAEGS